MLYSHCWEFRYGSYSGDMEQLGPHREILQETLRAEANQVCARALKDETSVSSMDISIQLHHSDLPEEMTLEDLRAADFVRADLKILNSFTNEEEFVKAAQPILKKWLIRVYHLTTLAL